MLLVAHLFKPERHPQDLHHIRGVEIPVKIDIAG